MTLSLITEPLPLQINPDGVVRVGETRVTLDTVVAAFNQGSTPSGKSKVKSHAFKSKKPINKFRGL
jgi:hypothetical protein